MEERNDTQGTEENFEEHPLEHTYCIWFNRRAPGPRTPENYEKNMKVIATFSTDEANKLGGKYYIRLKKDVSSQCWEDLIMAVIGEQFGVGDEICGAVISIRYLEDII